MCILMINKDYPRLYIKPGSWKLEDDILWPSVLLYSAFGEILRSQVICVRSPNHLRGLQGTQLPPSRFLVQACFFQACFCSWIDLASVGTLLWKLHGPNSVLPLHLRGIHKGKFCVMCQHHRCFWSIQNEFVDCCYFLTKTVETRLRILPN